MSRKNLWPVDGHLVSNDVKTLLDTENVLKKYPLPSLLLHEPIYRISATTPGTFPK